MSKTQKNERPKASEAGQGLKVPHLLKYMGSKREIIDFVKGAINSVGKGNDWLCDLFAGTAIVSGTLKGDYNIHSNDIQAYSAIFAQTYLSNLKGDIPQHRLAEIHEKVRIRVNQFARLYPELAFSYEGVADVKEFQIVEKAQQALIDKEFGIGFHLFAKNYSGTYWSYEQCVWIDSIRAVSVDYQGNPEYFAILSSLIFAMSYSTQSTGHFAQYRDANTDSSMQDILTYRKKQIWPYFERKFLELTMSMNGDSKPFRVTTLDYKDCLRIIEENSIVYADPPYQMVHYSRFYHAIETLVRYDNPKVSYKGRYREDRHQSPFCKRTTVEGAFASLFEGVKESKSHLVLSYSNTGIITFERITELASMVFGRNYKANVLKQAHVHSNMGRSDEKEQAVTEYALIYKCK